MRQRRNHITDHFIVAGVPAPVERQPESRRLQLGAGQMRAVYAEIIGIKAVGADMAEKDSKAAPLDNLDRNDVMAMKPANRKTPPHFAEGNRCWRTDVLVAHNQLVRVNSPAMNPILLRNGEKPTPSNCLHQEVARQYKPPRRYPAMSQHGQLDHWQRYHAPTEQPCASSRFWA